MQYDTLASSPPIAAQTNHDLAHQANNTQRQLRRNWLAVLARATRAQLEQNLQPWARDLRYELLRRPECGMVMLRARMGGTGDPFNMGEATVSRCTVRLPSGQVGCGHVLGRDLRRAELVAVFDALLQEPQYQTNLQTQVIDPLLAGQRAARAAVAQATAGSKVEFFTWCEVPRECADSVTPRLFRVCR